jgi:DNA helicase-2/ATP-dependent DNA helicase PcrA
VAHKNETSFDQFYDRLNPQQKQAVDAIDGPVMVLAGPGTGKTQVLAMRLANILRQTHMDPWNMLCLTFTESGVVAMRERLLKIIGPTAYQLRIHTFHSFCNDIIKDHPELFSLSRDWQVLAEVERVELLRDIVDSLPGTSPLKPFGNPYLYLADLASNIKQLKQEDISADQFESVLDAIGAFTAAARQEVETFSGLSAKERSQTQCSDVHAVLDAAAKAHHLPDSVAAMFERIHERFEERLDAADGQRDIGKACTAYKNELKRWFERLDRQLPKQRDMRRVYLAYQKDLRSRGRFDYEDMVMLVINELKKNEALLAEYQEQFQYLLVDEYQDTNGAQNELVYLLGSFDEQPNIFVVGDDKQSIYRFQGASMTNMLSFYQKYKEHISVIALKENYRSQANVLAAAAGVIAHNQESVTKYIPGLHDSLTPAAGRPVKQLEAHTFSSEESEDYAVAQRIAGLVKSGVEPKEIAVLFRYNKDGGQLLKLLTQLKIPARLEAGQNILEDITVRQWLTVFEYIANPGRSDLLAELLHYPWWGIDSLDALKVTHWAGVNRKKLLTVLADAALLKEAGVVKSAPLEKLVHYIADWQQDTRNMVLQELLYCLLNESGWLTYVLERDNQPTTLTALSRMTTLLNEAKRLNFSQHDITLQQFIDHIRLLREHNVPLNAEPWQVADNAVRLMTAHKSKGLEFEYVFLTRVNDKHWGNNPEPNRLPLPHGFIRYDMVVAQENNEDERRLFYVALTRAKQQIVVTRSDHSATGRPTIPSIFWAEIPADIVEVHEEAAEDPAQTITRLATALRPTPLADHDGIRHWLKNLLQGYTLSVTHLNTYLDCPRRFYIRNLLQVPTVRTQFQSLGTAVHNALRDFFNEFTKTGRQPSQEQLLAWFQQHVQYEILTEVEKKDTLHQGQALLTNYYARYRDQFSPNVLTEFSFDGHGVHVDGIPLTGQLDKIELLDATDIQKSGRWREGAHVNVVDYKTGNPERGAAKVKAGEDYFRQLVFYKLLCDSSAKFPYVMDSGEVDFVQPNKKGEYIKKQVKISDSDIDELKATIKRVCAEIHELKFLHDDSACGECEECKR